MGGRLVDPDGGGDRRWAGRFVDEALGASTVGCSEHFGTALVGLLSEAEMHGHWCHQADAGVPVLVVVPVEERSAELAGCWMAWAIRCLAMLANSRC